MPIRTMSPGAFLETPSSRSGRQSLNDVAVAEILITSAPVERIACTRAVRSIGMPW